VIVEPADSSECEEHTMIPSGTTVHRAPNGDFFIWYPEATGPAIRVTADMACALTLHEPPRLIRRPDFKLALLGFVGEAVAQGAVIFDPAMGG
jgi:hypothetical protein